MKDVEIVMPEASPVGPIPIDPTAIPIDQLPNTGNGVGGGDLIGGPEMVLIVYAAICLIVIGWFLLSRIPGGESAE